MTYLVLAADYLDYSLMDPRGDEFDRTSLPDGLAAQLESWNRDYQSVIPLAMERRAEQDVADRIQALDRVGQELARLIARTLPAIREVSYYSEGLLRRLDARTGDGKSNGDDGRT
jgi:hypothetical protein